LCSVFGLLALAASASPDASAGEVVMFTDRVPTAAELANLLWPGAAAAQPGIRSRSLKTRAIRLGADAGARASAAVPAAYRQTAAAEPQTTITHQQTAAAEPSPAPPPAPAESAAAAESSGFGFNIRFAFNSTEVLPESFPYLEQVGALLRSPQAQGQAILVVGHTDATGAEPYNEGLSQRRALAVARYLVQQHGIAPERLQVAGLGERQPLQGTNPFDPRNRRVEFHAVQ
jgi:outer membrane protein OmpA-like peptidoglycan-associated protein